MYDTRIAFGERFAGLLGLQGWSHETLAYRLEVSYNHIGKIIKGQRKDLGLGKAHAIAQALNISLDWLATGETRAPEELTPEEQTLLDNYRRIETDHIRAFVLESAKSAPKREGE